MTWPILVGSPFGLRSAPFIFDSAASMVEWIIVNSYMVPDLQHHLDDFILAGPPDPLICAQHLSTAMMVYQQLGLLPHTKKCEGPSTWLVSLGFHFSTLEFQCTSFVTRGLAESTRRSYSLA